MFRGERTLFIAILCSWVALGATAVIYSHEHPQTSWMTAVLPAFLLEAMFYLCSLLESGRELIRKFPPRFGQATALWLSALTPYAVFSVSTRTFDQHALILLTALSGVLVYWYVVLPKRFVYDLGFLAIAAAPILLRVFPRVYRSPDPRMHPEILGHLMWIRLGIAALLIFREWNPGAFGLWPRSLEWRAGMLWYLVSLVPLIAVALIFHDAQFAPIAYPWWRDVAVAVGTFFGILWVVAASEELLFRGVVERALLNGWGSPFWAILVSALLFGACHLWFRQFPNWRQAIVATVLGIGCGIGYWRTGSVRTPMVTHALVVTTWRVFFK